MAEELTILAIGDIVGRPGRQAVSALVGRYRDEQGVEFVVANAENAAAGSGLTPKIVEKLLSSGVDVITTGDHVFRNREVEKIIDDEPRLLRPANLSRRATDSSRLTGLPPSSAPLPAVCRRLHTASFRSRSRRPLRAPDT